MILGDGGIETDLIFRRGQDLPHFAAFVLLETEEGSERGEDSQPARRRGADH